jgi:hypothetical protein
MSKPQNISIQGYSKLFKTIEKPSINIRPIEEKDFIIACKMLNDYHQKFNICLSVTAVKLVMHKRCR